MNDATEPFRSSASAANCVTVSAERAIPVAVWRVASDNCTIVWETAAESLVCTSVVWEMASTILSAVGAVLTTMVVLRLGRSFSTMAEARTLVTSGFYSLVRHPLYLAEELIIIGGFLQFRSWPAALIVVLHFVFQLERVRCEEEVLTEAYPEYATYRATTARLIPGVY